MTSCSISFGSLTNTPSARFRRRRAFSRLFPFFPFVMLLMALLKQLPFSTDELFVFFTDLFPQSFPISFRLRSRRFPPSSGAIISISAVTALWSASRGVLHRQRSELGLRRARKRAAISKRGCWRCFIRFPSSSSSSRCCSCLCSGTQDLRLADPKPSPGWSGWPSSSSACGLSCRWRCCRSFSRSCTNSCPRARPSCSANFRARRWRRSAGLGSRSSIRSHRPRGFEYILRQSDDGGFSDALALRLYVYRLFRRGG